MEKIRMTRIMVCEYEPNPEYYPEAKSIEDMAVADASIDDPSALWGDNESITKDNTSWIIIGGNRKPQRQDA